MIFEKLTTPKTHLEVDDLTPQAKKTLYDIMQRHGATQGFAYDRFFHQGFASWELMGVDTIKRTFIRDHRADIFPKDMDKSLMPSTADMVSGKGVFYRFLGLNSGNKKAFQDYMQSLGMGVGSVINKFTSDDWKDYERIGIIAVLKEFERKVKKEEAIA